MIKTVAFLTLALVISACSSPGGGARKPNEWPGARPRVENEGPVRYLAWLEGDYQTGYEANREVAASRLAELESKPPPETDAEAYLEYISVLDAAGRHTDVEKKLKTYLTKFPDEKRAVFLLAVHYWRVNKKELTSFFFNQLEKDADFPWKALLYNNQGMIALQEKNRVQAIGYFEKATKEKPATAAPLVNLGALYLQSRSYAAAEGLFRKAIDLDESFEDAALGLGASLEGQGKFEQAHQVYADYMNRESSSLSVVYNDAVLLGNRLSRKADAAQMMLRYIQRGGKETAKAQEILQSWR